jgi:hypothetical protein
MNPGLSTPASGGTTAGARSPERAFVVPDAGASCTGATFADPETAGELGAAIGEVDTAAGEVDTAAGELAGVACAELAGVACAELAGAGACAELAGVACAELAGAGACVELVPPSIRENSVSTSVRLPGLLVGKFASSSATRDPAPGRSWRSMSSLRLLVGSA